MAVEIPVYVNIQEGFNQAAKDIPKEMPKLERVISKNALKIPVYFGHNQGFRTVQDALIATNVSANELKQVLHDLEYQFNRTSKAEANKARTSAKVKDLAKAYQLVEQRITGVSRSTTGSALLTQNAINKVLAKMQLLKSQMAGVSVGSEAWNKLNYQMRIQEQRLGSLQTQMMRYKAGITETTAEMKKQSGLLSDMTKRLGAYLSVYQLVRFVKHIRDVTGELEYQRVALGHLLQDTEYGNQLFARTIEAALKSPFRITQLVTYTKQLAAYRVEQENLYDTTQRLADVSAGLGVDMNRLILAYGQVRAASVLRGQELRQFTEAGIPIVELLAEKFTELNGKLVTTADVFKLISERAVPFSMISDIFEDMTNKGGMFYKMQEEQAKTLKGRWEKLKDAYDRALMSLGENDTFQRWNDIILKSLNGIASNLRGIVRIVNAATISWVAYKVATAVVSSNGMKLARVFAKDYGAAGLLTVAVNGLTTAWKKFTIAIKSNWVGLAISAIAGLITYFTAFRDKAKGVTSEMSDMEKAIESMSKANKENHGLENLIKRYEVLSSKTERTATENLKLSQTMRTLKDEFPELRKMIDDENVSLEEQVRLLNEAREARLEEERERAKKQLNVKEVERTNLEKDVLKLEGEYEKAYSELISWQKIAQEGVAEFNKQLIGTGTRGLTEKDVEKNVSKWAEAADKIKTKLDETEDSLEKVNKEITRLKNQISPEEAVKDWAQWQKEIKKVQDSMLVLGDTPVFTDKELQEFTSIYDLSKKLKTKIDDLTTSIKGMKSQFSLMTDKGSESAKALDSEIKASEKTLEMAEAIRIALGLVFSKGRSGSDSRLSDLKKKISEVTNAYKKFLELRKYMSEEAAKDEMKKLFPQLKGFEPTLENTIERIKSFMAGYKGPKDKVYLEMQNAIDTEVSNLNFDNLKKKLETDLKRISDSIKRNETIRNFYDEILGLTGDTELSASITASVYGTDNIGDDFKDRIQKELYESLKAIDPQMVTGGEDMLKKILGDASTLNWDEIDKNIKALPEDVQNVVARLRSDMEKYDADFVKNMLKTYQKAKTYEERITDVKKREQAARDKIRATAPKELQPSLVAASEKKEAEDIAAIQLEAMKDTYTWTKAFEDLNGVSTRTLDNLIDLIDQFVLKYGKDLEPQQLKELIRAKEQAKAQKTERNAFSATADAIKRYRKAQEQKNKLAKDGKKNTEEYTQSLDDQQKALADLQSSLEEITAMMNAAISSTKELLNVFASDKDAAYFSEQLDNVSKTATGAVKAGVGIAQLAAGIITPQAIMQTLTGLADIVAGIFGARNAKRIKKANDDIEEQDRILKDLEYQYGRLENAIAKSFGSDYIANYNKQLENLAAKQSAYLAQAEAERSKGKKADEEKIKEYEDAARDAADSIADMQTQLPDFFAGTDVTSAAKDFANAWIEAYKEFGSTTTAMKEKFQDVVQEMVQNSLAAQIMQRLLKPIFDQIDELAQEGGELSVADIATIAKKAADTVPQINDAMLTLMNALTASGYNIRQQAGQFTGISRNIANATEESIVGLAAGINTQNFYMSSINQNVAAILSIISGGNTVQEGGIPAVQFNNELALEYMSALPTIDQNLARMLRMMESVIAPRNSSAPTHYVAVRE